MQELLSNPVLDSVVNAEAKQMLLEAPHEYEHMVQQCVVESQRLHGKLDNKVLIFFCKLVKTTCLFSFNTQEEFTVLHISH